jgi:hypothetical protein
MLNLKNIALTIWRFYKQNPNEVEPPVRLDHWIRYAKEDIFNGEHLDNNKL